MEGLIIHPKGKVHHYNNVVVVVVVVVVVLVVLVVVVVASGGGPVLVCPRLHAFSCFFWGERMNTLGPFSFVFFFGFGLLGNMRLAFNKFQPLGGGSMTWRGAGCRIEVNVTQDQHV